MLTGTLEYKDGAFIVTPETWSGATMRGAPTELPLYPDCLDKFSPALTDIESWEGKVIKFELAKKYLADKTVYYANVIPSKITVQWDDLFTKQGKEDGANYHLLKEWLKKNCNPPTTKSIMIFNK